MGSELNILKESCIRGKLRRNKSTIFYVAGIGRGSHKTRGSIQLKILGRSVKFHLVRENFPISTCGILAIEFLREKSAALTFENGDTLLNLPNLNASSPYTITLPDRTLKLTTLPIVSTNLQEGYLNKINVGPGVFIGESPVRPENGMVKLYDEEKSSLLDPITEFSHRFYLEGDVLGSTDVISHEIHTTDETPIFHKQYRPAEIHHKEILNQTRKLLTDNFIEDSDSP